MRCKYFHWIIFLAASIVYFGCEKNSEDEISELPEFSALTLEDISQTSAVTSGSISSTGGLEITDKGICWSEQRNPTINNEVISAGSGSGSFKITIQGLQSSKSYYVRAYATSNNGTGYSNEVAFSTLGTPAVTVQDIEGNAYTVIEIGDQAWMGRNLQVTKFRNGTDIPLITEDSRWEDLTTPAYSFYNNANGNSYGPLYNGYVIMTDEICPEGWHIPTESDWTLLFETAGGKEVAGGKLKEARTLHWSMPNVGATDEFRFTALPGGLRYIDGSFRNGGDIGYWYTAPKDSSSEDLPAVAMTYDGEEASFTGGPLNNGASIRCVRD